MGCNLFRLGLDLVERFYDRGNSDRAGTRPVGAHPELHLVGVAMHHADVVDGNPEPLGNDLGKGRLVALPVRMTTGQNLDCAGGIDPYLGRFPQAYAAAERTDRLTGRDPARLDVGGESEP